MASITEIRIACALIEDGEGRVLLVRKAGTDAFMQAGGKIEAGEAPADALCRELAEELGLSVRPDALEPLGQFSAPAAHETGCVVVAELFRLRIARGDVSARAEIAEAVWVTVEAARGMSLAPLTRDRVLGLAAVPS